MAVLLTHDFNDGGPPLRVASWSDLANWAQEESKAWTWLREPPIPQIEGLSSLYKRYRQLADIEHLARQLDLNTGGDPEAIVKTLQTHLANLGPRSTSPIGKLIDEFRLDSLKGPKVAASILQSRFAPDHRLEGTIAALLHEQGVSPASTKAAKRALDELVKTCGNKFGEHLERMDKAEKGVPGCVSKIGNREVCKIRDPHL